MLYMWETDIGYFGVPNGEQVKNRLEVANRSLDYDSIWLVAFVCC